MSKLSKTDSLTGIANKTAYDEECSKLNWAIANGNAEFGIAMIDLNYLKKLNDTFGHDKGNIAIKILCETVRSIFSTSKIFRIGGDEFVIVFKGKDYKESYNRIAEFRDVLNQKDIDDSLPVWERISAAVGYTEFDYRIDQSVENVFKRADELMYENKKAMKAVRA